MDIKISSPFQKTLKYAWEVLPKGKWFYLLLTFLCF